MGKIWYPKFNPKERDAAVLKYVDVIPSKFMKYETVDWARLTRDERFALATKESLEHPDVFRYKYEWAKLDSGIDPCPFPDEQIVMTMEEGKIYRKWAMDEKFNVPFEIVRRNEWTPPPPSPPLTLKEWFALAFLFIGLPAWIYLMFFAS